ncbi:hypothetical protein [Longitalea luteola]|uniref:hypothetical protein n=1 Tax=Longitalea luteola TaxID=2812563 RepID=UPI001A96518E|nr:hypothetical protein [Longitalea luteola]
MTSDLALEYISKRMLEMGYGNSYLIRFRHLLFRAQEKRELIGYNQLYILIEPTKDIRIESDVGLYDQNEDHANELQYEHRGAIKIINLSPLLNNVRFIQAIPINQQENGSNQREV